MTTQLPRDADGKLIPHDDPGIQQDHWLIRRIHDKLVVEDGSGGRRISSLAFKSSNGELSVDLQNMIERAGLDAAVYVTTSRWLGAIRFQAGPVRKLKITV